MFTLGLANERYDTNEQAFTQTVKGTVDIKTTERWSVMVGASSITITPDGITIKTPKLDILVDTTITETAGVSITEKAPRIDLNP